MTWCNGAPTHASPPSRIPAFSNVAHHTPLAGSVAGYLTLCIDVAAGRHSPSLPARPCIPTICRPPSFRASSLLPASAYICYVLYGVSAERQRGISYSMRGSSHQPSKRCASLNRQVLQRYAVLFNPIPKNRGSLLSHMGALALGEGFFWGLLLYKSYLVCTNRSHHLRHRVWLIWLGQTSHQPLGWDSNRTFDDRGDFPAIQSCTSNDRPGYLCAALRWLSRACFPVRSF
ncbi:hypothetical protein GQ53DRAFT_155087 [Thozetella sp. PMI_491]|nr:hypothetical protein GQ53DRAFT_155087 [Thozetella sp. PMI_491]